MKNPLESLPMTLGLGLLITILVIFAVGNIG
jgi:hypothetical protein